MPYGATLLGRTIALSIAMRNRVARSSQATSRYSRSACDGWVGWVVGEKFSLDLVPEYAAVRLGER